ncbi:hypothetical protein BDF21DRAFT_411389 [Thamnidium elegans]|nr:hypothetical protein BDF21DRAFT_411389 [Thamnidium elegans]
MCDFTTTSTEFFLHLLFFFLLNSIFSCILFYYNIPCLHNPLPLIFTNAVAYCTKITVTISDNTMYRCNNINWLYIV